jgi:glycosyltransferase involved in cell wall biosynthesis
LPSLTLSISFGSNNIPRHERAIKPLGDQPALQDLEGRRVYLSVFNPGDFRKNAEKILRGFATFADEHPEAVLIVKLVIDNERPTLAVAQQHTLLPKFREETLVRSNNVIFISAFLDDDDMGRLYGLSDHYVCLSVGEGQNLPLCEAMGHGVVPISVSHTAMADYIDPSLALVVPSTRTWLALAEASRWSVEGRVDGFDCTEQDYLCALEESLALSPLQLGAMAQAAHCRALEQFSPSAVVQGILEQSSFDFRNLV